MQGPDDEPEEDKMRDPETGIPVVTCLFRLASGLPGLPDRDS